jgi:hypothetical protein
VLLPSRPARFFFALSAVFNDAHEITEFAARNAMVCAALSRSQGGILWKAGKLNYIT